MTIFLDILKFFVVLVYMFFLLDAMLGIKYDSDEGDLSWFGFVYLAYSFFNVIIIIKLLHR